MPNGRRKQMFSNKQKKLQLKQKRDKKRTTVGAEHERQSDSDDDDDDVDHTLRMSGKSAQRLSDNKINFQAHSSKSRDVNRYALQFFAETDDELKHRKERSRISFQVLPETSLEISSEEAFAASDGGNTLDMPKRPVWDLGVTGEQLEAREHKYFRTYLDHILAANEARSYFDLNLETWRQLWRVLEMSDIVLLIADIRHPVFHFPPSLYHYVVNELKKDMILVLNKIDLVSAPIVVAWTHYLKSTFPELHVVSFASYAGMKVKKRKKRIGKLRMAANGAKSLLAVCEKIVNNCVDLSSWRSKIEQELREEESAANDNDFSDDEDDNDFNPLLTAEKIVEKVDLSFHKFERYKDGIVTIGCVGHPNVGKSSLLNAVMGKKVVSVSRTPGHTKHFQTIFLTPTVRLCDCPGLVFPSRAPKEVQVLMGCFPIAQLREPYSAIGYMGQRMNLPAILKVKHPNQEGNKIVPTEWSAFDICESWAIKRGFYTAKAARPDVYRAANNLLRMALDGRTLCLAFFPPNYIKERKSWENHVEVKLIESIQGEKMVSSDDEDNCHHQAFKSNRGDSANSSESEESEEEDDYQIVTKSKFALLEDCE